ncbi:MAG TPA: TlpA disulfide reductase family protein [Pyrinomonadaceae bacterium]|jgi:thiol-disulfide isomerase/thioredoxin|nr:TlpA disulfide reductase family protein [Pyrinomonadaceae bacterium]
MSTEPNSAKSGFFTPMRIVTVCAAAAIGIAIWISSSKTSQPSNQPPAAATPVVQVNPAPNGIAPSAAPPVFASVPLADSIRQTKVKTIDGGSVKLADFKNKVVVVNLWATWCGPCRMEMPDLVKLNNEYKSRGLVVIGVATTYNERDNLDGVKEFVKAQKVDYKVLWDDGTLAQPLVQSVNGRNNIPQSFVISRDGKITKHFTGFSPVSTPTLMRQAVEDALSDKGKA